MKCRIYLLLILIFFSNLKTFATDFSLANVNQTETLEKSLEIKYSYRKAKNSLQDFENFNSLVSNLANSDLKDAYVAASMMLSCKFKKNPFAKISCFKSGRTQLESLISEHSDSLELRYIRLAIQLNTPALLSYKDNIEEDKNFLLNEIKANSKLDKKVKNYLHEFLSRYELI